MKTEVKISDSNKGGARTPKRLKYKTQRLLKVLWEREGGPHQLYLKTGILAQKFIYWRNKGYVSYSALGKVSRALNIPIKALDYVGLSNLYGQAAGWEQLLVTLDLTKEQENYIESGAMPKLELE